MATGLDRSRAGAGAAAEQKRPPAAAFARWAELNKQPGQRAGRPERASWNRQKCLQNQWEKPCLRNVTCPVVCPVSEEGSVRRAHSHTKGSERRRPAGTKHLWATSTSADGPVLSFPPLPHHAVRTSPVRHEKRGVTVSIGSHLRSPGAGPHGLVIRCATPSDLGRGCSASGLPSVFITNRYRIFFQVLYFSSIKNSF
uniref:Uncharacterized protein n=1 Tax=Rousettus aegyptiacus TaxID=9407 RepID=A0A7J8JJB6_ROUAE|nr:hypothetical protein HJG63_010410 [Rousettus aegyptiacus]